MTPHWNLIGSCMFERKQNDRATMMHGNASQIDYINTRGCVCFTVTDTEQCWYVWKILHVRFRCSKRIIWYFNNLTTSWICMIYRNMLADDIYIIVDVWVLKHIKLPKPIYSLRKPKLNGIFRMTYDSILCVSSYHWDTFTQDNIEIYSVLSRLKTYKLIPSNPAPKPIWSTPATFRKWFKWAEIAQIQDNTMYKWTNIE